MGWSLSETQGKLLLSVTDKISLFLYNDFADQESTRTIHKRLIHKVFLKVVAYPTNLPEKTQPEHFTKDKFVKILGSKWSCFDAGINEIN